MFFKSPLYQSYLQKRVATKLTDLYSSERGNPERLQILIQLLDAPALAGAERKILDFSKLLLDGEVDPESTRHWGHEMQTQLTIRVWRSLRQVDGGCVCMMLGKFPTPPSKI